MIKKIISLFLFLASLSFVFGQTKYYVSESGDDSNDGSSWNTAFKTVGKALEAITDTKIEGNEIWIAKGTYAEGKSLTMKNNVGIYGGFAGTETDKAQRVSGYETILSGENSYRIFDNRFTYGSRLDNTAILDSVTIKNGKTEEFGGGGGGMENIYANPTVNNCIFTENTSSYEAGAIVNSSSSPIIKNCTFLKNNSDSFGGAIYNNSGSWPTIANCTFIENTAKEGGGAIYNHSITIISTLEIRNCTFSKNKTYESSNDGGGAIYNEDSNIIITNCTFSENVVESANSVMIGYGGAIYYRGNSSNSTITNCIFWGNIAARNTQIYGAKKVSYSIVQDGYEGIGNISVDPRFMPLGNYGGFVPTMPLRSTSPAIGAGATQAQAGVISENIVIPTTDAIGQSRDTNLASTIGAVEYNDNFIWYEIEYDSSDVLVDAPFELRAILENPDIVATYQWYKDGVAIDGATSAIYVAIQSESSASYYCVITVSGISTTTSSLIISTHVPMRIYVSKNGDDSNDGTSWNKAFRTLGKALTSIKNPAEGNEIWIAKGVYAEGSSLKMKNNVGIYGGFAGKETDKSQRIAGANETILSGEGSYHVFYNTFSPEEPLKNTSLLDSVTIKNSKTIGPSVEGIAIVNFHASPIITNCTFTGNNGVYHSGKEFVTYRGTIYNYDSYPIIANCTFTENSGGGIVNDYSNPTITNCTFMRNNAISDIGSGIHNAHSDPTITNCNFNGNNKRVIYNWHSNPIITNCIIWGNTGNSVYNSNSMPTISYSIVEGGYEGTGNFDVAPKLTFILGDWGGSVKTLALGYGSPAIGAGASQDMAPEGVIIPTTDARGVARPADGRPCIGAYEGFVTLALSKNIEDIAVPEKSSFSFDVSAQNFVEGSKTSYTWYVDKNDGKAPVEVGSSASYKAKAKLSMMGYKYYCVVSNGTETITSNIAELIILSDSVKIGTQPKAGDIYIGGNTSLSISTTDDPDDPTKYIWQVYKQVYNSKGKLVWAWVDIDEAADGILGMDTPILSFEDISSARDGEKYRCIASNSKGSVVSKSVTLKVKETASIATQPADQVKEYGETAKFTVSAKGTKTIKYQWYVFDEEENAWVLIDKSSAAKFNISSAATSASYSVKKVDASHDALRFKCNVWNDPTQTKLFTEEVVLYANKKTVATTQFTSVASFNNEDTNKIIVSAEAEDKIRYTVEYLAPKANSKTGWTLLETNTLDGDKADITYEHKLGNDGGVNIEVGGKYRFTVWSGRFDEASENDALCKRVIVKDIKIVKSISQSDITEGSAHLPEAYDYREIENYKKFAESNYKAVFAVSAKGAASLKYQWYYFDGFEWNKLSDIKGIVSGSQSAKLTISTKDNAQYFDYSYKCLASNYAGTVESAEYAITKLGLPEIEVHPENTEAVEGASASFTVKVSAKTGSKATYKWEYKKASSNKWVAVSGAKTNGLENTLTIKKVKYTMADGQYRCVVSNALSKFLKVDAAQSETATMTVRTKSGGTWHYTGSVIGRLDANNIFTRANDTFVYYGTELHIGNWELLRDAYLTSNLTLTPEQMEMFNVIDAINVKDILFNGYSIFEDGTRKNPSNLWDVNAYQDEEPLYYGDDPCYIELVSDSNDYPVDYQWYISRNGVNFLPMEGETSSLLEISPEPDYGKYYYYCKLKYYYEDNFTISLTSRMIILEKAKEKAEVLSE